VPLGVLAVSGSDPPTPTLNVASEPMLLPSVCAEVSPGKLLLVVTVSVLAPLVSVNVAGTVTPIACPPSPVMSNSAAAAVLPGANAARPVAERVPDGDIVMLPAPRISVPNLRSDVLVTVMARRSFAVISVLQPPVAKLSLAPETLVQAAGTLVVPRVALEGTINVTPSLIVEVQPFELALEP
jgi:hypothetical protein